MSLTYLFFYEVNNGINVILGNHRWQLYSLIDGIKGTCLCCELGL